MWPSSSKSKNNPSKKPAWAGSEQKTTRFSETSVDFQRTTWRCIPEDRTLREKITVLQQNAYYCCIPSTGKPYVSNIALSFNSFFWWRLMAWFPNAEAEA
jgi:hypothetical protein